MEVFHDSFKRRFAKFTERELVGVVADLFEDGIEVVFVEDELHETLSLNGQITLSVFSRCAFPVTISFIIIAVAFLDKGVFLRLGRLVAVLPFVARLVLELFIKVLQSLIKRLRAHGLILTGLANASPSSVGVIVLSFAIF